MGPAEAGTTNWDELGPAGLPPVESLRWHDWVVSIARADSLVQLEPDTQRMSSGAFVPMALTLRSFFDFADCGDDDRYY